MSSDPVGATALHDTTTHQLVLTLLSALSAQSPSAREAYAALLPALANHEGDIPTGAKLVDCVQWFNANRPAGMARIPLGTAGVAQECVTIYRRSLVQSSARQQVVHQTLPAALLQQFNGWLQQLVEMTHTGLQQQFTQELEVSRAQMAEEMQRLTEQHSQQLAALQTEFDQANAALSASEEERQTLEHTLEIRIQQAQALQTTVQVLERDLDTSTRQAETQQQTIQKLEHQLAQLQTTLDATRQAEDTERKQRLLLVDTLRIQEQALTHEKERHQATRQAQQALETYWQEEKEKTKTLQLALTQLQMQWTEQQLRAVATVTPSNVATAAQRQAAGRVQWRQRGAIGKLGKKKPPVRKATGGLR